MKRRAGLTLAFALAIASLTGCNSAAKAPLEGNYFPLTPNSTWTYQIISKSRRIQYRITDRVLGRKYIPSLEVSGFVVNESYSLPRGGIRPLVYYTSNGYISRLSALAYDKKKIEAPAWGRSEETDFLPVRLAPNLTWKNVIFPYGHLSGAFHISQVHHSFAEPGYVDVPAGRFAGCIRIETQARYQGGIYAKQGKALQLTYFDWYAPGVGLVKTVVMEGGQNGHEMEQVKLTRFKIAPAAGARPGH